MNKAPKFGKIELLIKQPRVSFTSDIQSTEKIEFLDSGLMITGDHIIVIIDERDELKNTLTSTGKIFNLKDIVAYKTHSI
jgi:hypothetical protein